jgi:hypothetical protein
VTKEEIKKSIEHLEVGRQLCDLISHQIVREELLVGIDCTLAGLLKAQGQPITPAQAVSLETRYRQAWLQRARVGGLEESVRELHLT